MEDQHQSKTVHNDGITLPDHDFTGLSQVLEKAKPTLPGTENGFVPLKDYDLSKPHEDFAKHLEKWQERLDESPIDPANAIEELKARKKELEQKRENDLEQRITDIKNDYSERKGEWKEHLTEVLRLKDDEIGIWRGRVDELKAKNHDLEKQRDDERNNLLDELRRNNDQRVADLERYHANELALTERFAQLMEQKHIADEHQNRVDKETIEEDRRKWYQTMVTSIRDSSLAKLFK